MWLCWGEWFQLLPLPLSELVSTLVLTRRNGKPCAPGFLEVKPAGTVIRVGFLLFTLTQDISGHCWIISQGSNFPASTLFQKWSLQQCWHETSESSAEFRDQPANERPWAWRVSDFTSCILSKDAWKGCIFLPPFRIFGEASLRLYQDLTSLWEKVADACALSLMNYKHNSSLRSGMLSGLKHERD